MLISEFVDWNIHVQVMAFQGGRSKQQAPQEFKMIGGTPPGFSNKPSTKVDPFGALGSSDSRNGGKLSVSSSGSSSAFNGGVPDVGSFFGASDLSLNSVKDDFDSFLDDSGPDSAAPGAGIAVEPSQGETKHAVPAGAKTEGLFLPYLPQDDAVAAGLGAKDGGINASEAQEVVDQLNRQLASLLRLSPPEFWKKGAHRTVPSHLHDVFAMLLGSMILMKASKLFEYRGSPNLHMYHKVAGTCVFLCTK